MQGFTEIIRQYAADNRFSGELKDADGTGEVGLAADQAGRQIAVRFTLQLREKRITDLRYQVFGCGYSMATCAATAHIAIGVTVDEARTIDAEKIDKLLHGLPEDRRYCANLAAEALQAALTSACTRTATVQTLYNKPATNEHGPRVSESDPLYRSLMDSSPPANIAKQDRQLFACLLTVASHEPYPTADALGLTSIELTELQRTIFPHWVFAPEEGITTDTEPLPEINTEVRLWLLSQVPTDKTLSPISRWLAKILAARAAHPGHLWMAMGLFKRPLLSSAIRRHLPSVFAANNKNMRWKRFFFKQICDLNGGTLCRTPNCGECSDYPLCFAEDD